MTHRQIFIFIIFSLLILTSCDTNRFDVDINQVELDNSFVRLDVELQNGSDSLEKMKEVHDQLIEKYPQVYTSYFSKILQLGDPSQPSAYQNVFAFVNDKMMVEVQQEVSAEFGKDLVGRQKIQNALKRYSVFFPEDTIPSVAMYNSGFNYGIYPTSSYIGIGLEWYVGADNELLKRLPPSQFPRYLKEKMQREYLPSDAIRGYLLVKHSDKVEGNTLLSQLVYFGKIAYLMDALMPEEPDYLKYGYTLEQAEWCEANEFNIWKTLVKDELLYVKDRKKINSYIGNAPYTKGFSEESPGKLAFFIGKVMVADYMDVHGELSLEEMMSASSSMILKEYRPSK